MTPEYKFNIEGLVNKEKIVGGLMDSGYVVSVKKRFNDLYEISVYGKERVDGKGLKPSDFVVDTKSVDVPYIKTPGTWVGSGSINTASISCDPHFLVDATVSTAMVDTLSAGKITAGNIECHSITTKDIEQLNKEIVKTAIERDYGC